MEIVLHGFPSVFKLIEKRIDELLEPTSKMLIAYFENQKFENPMMETFIFGALIDGISFDYVMKPDIYPIEMIKKEIIRRYCNPKV